MAAAAAESNSILKALEAGPGARFLPRFQRVPLRRGAVLHYPGEPAEAVCFPLSGLVAVMSDSADGESVQTGMVGCEGAVGAFEAYVGGRFASKYVVQVGGEALRLGAATFRELCREALDFRQRMERYFEFLLTESRVLVMCNALHGVEARLARSILEALERSCIEGPLPLTQEALAQMLGAQRTTVAVAMSRLQRAGLVRSGRGAVTVPDRAALERLACRCHLALHEARRGAWGEGAGRLQRSG
ncbi:Crp/Fnr family transcriptional regulator [Phenylobacterium terrae]|uniref:Crp/Fnr family transcriptional regulator n=1 Tax=Phenylobacterium terrae TaxID=2665495 RepID=A0ABW4N6S8_9CAUL